ncbi:uncharacterized protein isoform X1 [Choristoneura fumiferana]|uniref:uncharacterized protein isoform X1 n=2 Tax=Choristoneura fumiferana TaxID=7141 RepID=UPI003D1549DB
MYGISLIFLSYLLLEVVPCPHYKSGPALDVEALVGTWLTVYTQPKSVNCFSLQIRATTELERDQYIMKFGKISNSVDWSQCFLEVLSPQGKHFLQGNGSDSGLLENIFLVQNSKGELSLHKQRANQWQIFGHRGDEVLVMRDCAGGAAAAFARAPFWPTRTHLHAILHRSGVVCVAKDHVQCEPERFYGQHPTNDDLDRDSYEAE